MKRMMFGLLFATLATNAFAYYMPGQGRWLSRDPIGEPGFTVATTGQQPAAPADLDDEGPAIQPNRQATKPNELNLYGFVLNDPQNQIDALGLISFSRCDANQQALLTHAWNSVCQKVNDPAFQCCVGRPEYIRMFKRRCAWGNVKFKCRKDNEGLCPWACAHAWQSLGVGRGVIVVCESQFTNPSICPDPMDCVLIHEFTHVLSWDPWHGGIVPKVERCSGMCPTR
jgi:hypothetical protein